MLKVIIIMIIGGMIGIFFTALLLALTVWKEVNAQTNLIREKMNEFEQEWNKWNRR
ncbi:hypothetical protein Q3V94_13630 [Caloramator sp. CAR-1]|uniref:hypothetical protein n=1 Tax=Caloramator sp. CAR-1 TaxID=3062777 RepID=UPI0026E174DE|nr:hypothetical protein [Caloramator sp. CAR-1]MDO6355128.1 hypothetical protein [Caloramator sp. CAR-1]MDO6356091.1 hypothetical protein [Caloramator sp. CAR-1]